MIAETFKAAKLGGNDTIGILFSNNNTGGSSFSGGDGKWDGFFNAYGAYLNYWLEKDGKLVYSNVQPEIKTPLLAMQDLYKKGTMNRDAVVINNEVAQEYVASGKVGIFYASAWCTTLSMFTLHNNDPSSKIVNLYPPPAGKGKIYPIQTNTPKAMRIFVSVDCKYPEAVVKMANLTDRNRNENHLYYNVDENGFQYYKFLPWGVFAKGSDDQDRSEAFRHAELTGSLEKITSPLWEGLYNTHILALEGKAPYWNLLMNGKEGSFSTVWDAIQANLVLLDAYNGLPTETQALKGDIINSTLDTAMFEVVMGADISVYERAVEQWYANGGAQITEEVNAWYQSLKK
jgi:putative aldouronate transport system substrate-binding protein